MAPKPITLEFKFRNRRFKDAAVGLRTFYQTMKKGWDGTPKILSRELQDFLDSVAEALVQRHSTAWPGGTTKNTLSKRSGKLLKSIVESVQVQGQTFETISGTIGGSGIAKVQEFGATIKPKRAKYLTIPLPAALTPQGLPIHEKARDWPNTFVARSKAGNLIIFQRRQSQVVPLYVLKTSVYVPPRLGMQATLNKGLPYFVDRAMDAMVREIVSKIG